MIVRETAVLSVSNPILDDPEQPILEAAIGDLRVTDVRAIYPVMCAINSGLKTKNNTFYPKETLVGRKDIETPTGYSSFVMPTGKPVLKEHRFQDSQGFFGGGQQAEDPMGRVIYAAYKARKKDETQTQPKNKLVPGTVEGDGWMMLVPCVSEADAITKILGGAFHTISIGSEMESVVESISGIDLVNAQRKGEEMPIYSKGQVYKVDGKDRLSYWTMHGMGGKEVSYVNNPSDVRAFNKEKDIGEEGMRVLLGEKKQGSEQFDFFDAKTREKVENFLPEEFWAIDSTFSFIDSAKLPTFYKKEIATHRESMEMDETTKEKIDTIFSLLSELKEQLKPAASVEVEAPESAEGKSGDVPPTEIPEPTEQTPEETLKQILSEVMN